MFFLKSDVKREVWSMYLKNEKMSKQKKGGKYEERKSQTQMYVRAGYLRGPLAEMQPGA